MKKSIKPALIILSVILALILITAVIVGIIYINADAVRFDHVDCDRVDILRLKDESTINYPFFGNSLIINEKEKGVYSPFLGSAGLKNLEVYGAVNMPIRAYVEYLVIRKCSGGINLGYTVEQDSSTLTVNLNGIGTDDSGKNISIDENMVFNIENASPEKLPVWVNENEANEEFKEYWNYLNNTSTVPIPDWYAAQLGIN